MNPRDHLKKILENLCSKVLTVTIESPYELSIRAEGLARGSLARGQRGMTRGDCRMGLQSRPKKTDGLGRPSYNGDGRVSGMNQDSSSESNLRRRELMEQMYR